VSLLPLFNKKIGYSMVFILTKLFLRKQYIFDEIIFEEYRNIDRTFILIYIISLKTLKNEENFSIPIKFQK